MNKDDSSTHSGEGASPDAGVGVRGLFRKKPVVIEARQLTSQNVLALRHWITDAGNGGVTWDDQPTALFIPTMEGTMRAVEGDWIIRGVKGEFYPCKPDIFAATYEAVVSPSADNVSLAPNQASGPRGTAIASATKGATNE